MLFYGDDREREREKKKLQEEHVLLAQETERSMYIIFALYYSNGETISLSLLSLSRSLLCARWFTFWGPNQGIEWQSIRHVSISSHNFHISLFFLKVLCFLRGSALTSRSDEFKDPTFLNVSKRVTRTCAAITNDH